jgi:archaellum component FlaC
MSNGKKETRRHHLREKAVEAMDEDAADELMESLPPFDWHELATKSDLAAMEERQGLQFAAVHKDLDGIHKDLDGIHDEIGGIRSEIGGIHSEIGGIRSEVGSLHKEVGSLHKEIGGVRTELHREVSGLRADMASGFQELHKDLRDIGVKFAFACVMGMVGVGGFAVAASHAAP